MRTSGNGVRGLITVVAVGSLWVALNAGAANIMVFAPHEDDEGIACSGVIRNAVRRGDTVTLVMVTNGDYNGGVTKAETRLNQTIDAMDMLGLGMENIVYFGYADGTVLASAYKNPGQVFWSTDGVTSRTYGFTYMPDYHYTVFNTHAAYERSNILTDFYEVLSEHRPSQIYMPSPMESHRDHSTTALFVYEAIRELNDSSYYAPTIHEYMIYKNGLPQSSLNPAVPVSNSQAAMNNTPYTWQTRESIAVPLEMTVPFSSGGNLKYNVLRAYPGNADGGNFDRFIRSDEVFWRRQTNNYALSATVTVSSQNTGTGQRGTSATDGVIVGYPYQNSAFSLYDKEWATVGQLGGAWIQLSWNSTKPVRYIRLYDRPNTVDRVLSGTLTFSDGTSVAVGALPNNGGPQLISFSTKFITWVRFTVDSAQGSNIGLSEFEVFYSEPGDKNIAPLGRVSVSSESPATDQLGIKVTDGSITGYPNDYTREWATNRETDGAWIRFDFTRAYTINKIYLNDRPNSTDHISAGVLTFSDGSAVNVSSLPNNGSTLVVTFADKTVTWVDFEITQAEGLNIGLSEVRIFGTPL